MTKRPKKSVREAIRLLATLICDECESPDDEPCPGCVVHSSHGLQRVCAMLPAGMAFTPESLAIAIQEEIPV